MNKNESSQRIAFVLSVLTLIVATAVRADTFAEKQAVKAEVAEAQQPRVYLPEAVDYSTPRVTSRLASQPRVKHWVAGNSIRFVPKRAYPVPALGAPVNPPRWQVDPLLKLQSDSEANATSSQHASRIATPSVNIAGQSFSGVFPPDTVGDVGPAHYVQAINSNGGTGIQGFDKSGVSVFGPVLLDSLGSGACATGLGDPIVLYDQQADRWFLSEFSGVANALCV